MKISIPPGYGFHGSDAFEAPFCVRLNRLNSYPLWRQYFTLMGRLGNGIVWYALLALLPIVLGIEALPLTLHLTATALVGVAIYKVCKLLLVRERPFVTHGEVTCYGVPLDRGSFPSGHTIHAVSFTVMLGTLYPDTLWALTPLALSIALSRVILGHHYPSDVLAGAGIGFGLAQLSLTLMPLTIL